MQNTIIWSTRMRLYYHIIFISIQNYSLSGLLKWQLSQEVMVLGSFQGLILPHNLLFGPPGQLKILLFFAGHVTPQIQSIVSRKIISQWVLIIYLILILGWYPCLDGMHIVWRWCSTPWTEAKETLDSVPYLFNFDTLYFSLPFS